MLATRTQPFVNTKNSYDLEPAFSVDSRWLAYASNESGAFEVYVRASPGPANYTYAMVPTYIQRQRTGTAAMAAKWQQHKHRFIHYDLCEHAQRIADIVGGDGDLKDVA